MLLLLPAVLVLLFSLSFVVSVAVAVVGRVGADVVFIVLCCC